MRVHTGLYISIHVFNNIYFAMNSILKELRPKCTSWYTCSVKGLCIINKTSVQFLSVMFKHFDQALDEKNVVCGLAPLYVFWVRKVQYVCVMQKLSGFQNGLWMRKMWSVVRHFCMLLSPKGSMGLCYAENYRDFRTNTSVPVRMILGFVSNRK